MIRTLIIVTCLIAGAVASLIFVQPALADDYTIIGIIAGLSVAFVVASEAQGEGASLAAAAIAAILFGAVGGLIWPVTCVVLMQKVIRDHINDYRERRAASAQRDQ